MVSENEAELQDAVKSDFKTVKKMKSNGNCRRLVLASRPPAEGDLADRGLRLEDVFLGGSTAR